MYKCGKCSPQTVEKYCYECCEKSLLNEDDYIDALCMECAFCYDYINVSKFYKKQKKGGWQGLKFDCCKCTCCCDGADCVSGSLCCVINDDDDTESTTDDDENKEKDENN